MPSSLRARLLAWYSLVLVIVIATFAGTVAYLLWRSMVADVDAAAAHERRLARGSRCARPAPAGSTSICRSSISRRTRPQPGAATYYAVWNARGDLIDRSPVGFDIAAPASAGTAHARRPARARRSPAPDGALVLVGRDLAEARDAVRAFAGDRGARRAGRAAGVARRRLVPRRARTGADWPHQPRGGRHGGGRPGRAHRGRTDRERAGARRAGAQQRIRPAASRARQPAAIHRGRVARAADAARHRRRRDRVGARAAALGGGIPRVARSPAGAPRSGWHASSSGC